MHRVKMNLNARSSLAVRLACILLVGGAASCLTATAGSESLGNSNKGRAGELDRVLISKGLKGATVSALVVRERDGKILYSRTPDKMMTPASNAKVLTALAALDAFGPTHRFETEISTDVPPDANGEVGTLYLRGGGDPAITTEDYWRMASELRDKGIARVRGDLVLDDSLFDQVRWHPTVEGVSSRAYHAPVGALNANYGSFAVTVRPGANVGDPLLVSVNPPSVYLRVSNKGKTLPRKARRTVVVDRSDGKDFENVSIRGGLRLGDKPKTYYRSVLHPDRYAGAVLKLQLAALGIEVGGTDRSGRAPESAHLLHTFKGRSVAEIVRLFMKFSNNGIAEALVKNLAIEAGGAVGTWEAGVPEMRRRVIANGVPKTGFALVDGSGLSYHDKVSPRALVAALRAGRNSFEWGAEFVAALPIAARDGTLKDRADGAKDQVRAKTGLLNRVTGLSGYASIAAGKDSATAERVIFSVLANNYQRSDEEAMDQLDRFVTVLTTSK